MLAGEAIFVDGTPVALLVPGIGKTRTARLWAYARVAEHKINLIDDRCPETTAKGSQTGRLRQTCVVFCFRSLPDKYSQDHICRGECVHSRYLDFKVKDAIAVDVSAQ